VIDRESKATASPPSSGPTTTRSAAGPASTLSRSCREGLIVEIRGCRAHREVDAAAACTTHRRRSRAADHTLAGRQLLREEAMAQMEMALAAQPRIDLVYATTTRWPSARTWRRKAKAGARDEVHRDRRAAGPGRRTQAVATASSTPPSCIRRAAAKRLNWPCASQSESSAPRGAEDGEITRAAAGASADAAGRASMPLAPSSSGPPSRS